MQEVLIHTPMSALEKSWHLSSVGNLLRFHSIDFCFVSIRLEYDLGICDRYVHWNEIDLSNP